MRVYVTGSGGFVGRRLVARMRSDGIDPLGTDSEVDVTDASALGRALADTRPDAIVHLAAQSSVSASVAAPEESFRVNFLGARTLLDTVRRHVPAARVLLVGSGDSYGAAAPGTPPFRETDPLRPRSPYAWSKACAEWLGTLAARDGMDVVRVRAFNHTGPGQSDRFVASSFARQTAEIAAGSREARLRVGNLESARDFLDVDDVLDAYLALLDPEVPAAVYNVASGRSVTIRTLLETLLELGGVDPDVATDPARMRPTDSHVGDASRLRTATGWSPKTPLKKTLRALLDDWRARLDEVPAGS